MNRFNYLLILTAVSAFIFSCQPDSVLDENTTYNENTSNVENRQRVYDWEPGECGVNALIFISDDCEGNWADAVQPSIDAYNDLDIGILFNITENEADADMVINCHFMTSAIGLATELTEDGVIGDEIKLNTQFETGCSDDPCWYQYVVMHELGHNIGISHNGQESPVTTTFHVPGTDKNGKDRKSVFNACLLECGDGVCEFNKDDIKALEFLHKNKPTDPCLCPEWFEPCSCKTDNLGLTSISGSICSMNSAEYCISGDFESFEWSVTNGTILSGQGSNCVKISTSDNGNDMTVAVQVTNEDGCTRSVNKIVSTSDPVADISYNDRVCLDDVITFNINTVFSNQDVDATSWTITPFGLNIMSSNENHAVAEALVIGDYQVCVNYRNDCGTNDLCINVEVLSSVDCGSDPDGPQNPK